MTYRNVKDLFLCSAGKYYIINGHYDILSDNISYRGFIVILKYRVLRMNTMAVYHLYDY